MRGGQGRQLNPLKGVYFAATSLPPSLRIPRRLISRSGNNILRGVSPNFSAPLSLVARGIEP